MPEKVFVIVEEEEEGRRERGSQLLRPAPTEMPLAPLREERPFLLSVISLGLGGLGLLVVFLGLAILVAALGGLGFYIPGFGIMILESSPVSIMGSPTLDAIITSSLLMAVGVVAYVAGYGLWHFKHWAFGLALSLAVLVFVFGVGLVTLAYSYLPIVLSCYVVEEESVAELYSAIITTAVLSIGPAAFMMVYLVHVRRFFE